MSGAASVRPFKPNAWTKAQVSRRVGVTVQAVDDRIHLGKLEVHECWGTHMVPERSVRRWERERAARARRQSAY